MIVAHAGEQQYQSRSVQVHFLQNVEALPVRYGRFCGQWRMIISLNP